MVKRLVVTAGGRRHVVLDPRSGHITIEAGDRNKPEKSDVVIEAPGDFPHPEDKQEAGAGSSQASGASPPGKAPWPWPDVLITFVSGAVESGEAAHATSRQGSLTLDEVRRALAKVPDGSTHVIHLGHSDE